MKITAEKLAPLLKQSLAPVYLICGQETLLVQESCKLVRQHAKTKGFRQRQRFTVYPGFDWQQAQKASTHFSLFGNHTIIELHLTKNTLTAQASAFLNHYHFSLQQLLLITLDKIDLHNQKSNWYQKIAKQGIIVQLWPLKQQSLFNWAAKHLEKWQLKASPEIIACIIEHTQGNLLATAQEIEKLSLLFGRKPLVLSEVKQALIDNCRFNLFALSQSLFDGNSKGCVKIIANLKDQGLEPALVLWLLTREIRLLLTILENKATHLPKSQQLRYQHLAKQCNKLLLLKLLQKASAIDKMIKGIESGNVWDLLLSCTLQLCQACQ